MKPYILLVAPTSLVLKATAWLVTPEFTQQLLSMLFLKLLDNIKVTHPSLTKGHYYSDGCAGQYKNRYNIINLCHHKGLLAESHFFATSHVKLHVMGLVEQQNGLPLMLVFSDPFQIKSLPLKICLHFAGTTYTVCIFTL